MPYPATIANDHVEHTLHDSTQLVRHSIGLGFGVSAAGSVRIEDRSGTLIDVYFGVGFNVYPLRDAKTVRTTGTTATLSPAGKCYAFYEVSG